MTLPSDPVRNRRRGLSLIEAMLAMALLALVLGVALGGTGRTLRLTAERTDEAWLSELARSLADEYAVTRDRAMLQGRTDPAWRWRIDERKRDDGLVDVTVTTWRPAARNRTISLSVLVPDVPQ